MSSSANPARPSFFHSFTRSQLSALAATVADYGMIFLLVEAFHVWYVLATALGALFGGLVNFFMNRHWSFRAAHGKLQNQAFRYTLISGLSLSLNTFGVWAVTEGLHIHYFASVLIVSLLVGLFFNFPMHKLFVFR